MHHTSIISNNKCNSVNSKYKSTSISSNILNYTMTDISTFMSVNIDMLLKQYTSYLLKIIIHIFKIEIHFTKQ